jgi:hypothetical protein
MSDTAYSYASNDPVNKADPTGMSSSGLGTMNDWKAYCNGAKKEKKKICTKGKRANVEATLSAKAFYPNPLPSAEKSGPHNAYRHAYWSAILTHDFFGVTKNTIKAKQYAIEWTNLHEDGTLTACQDGMASGYNQSADTQSDCWNNSQGRATGIAYTGDSRWTLKKQTFIRMRDGHLKVWSRNSSCDQKYAQSIDRDCGGDDGYTGVVRASNQSDIAFGACKQFGIDGC